MDSPFSYVCFARLFGALACLIWLAACGGSAATCPSDCGIGRLCVEGRCVLLCDTPQVQCAGVCADLRSNSDHCGGCNQRCPTSQVCVQGVCDVPCPVDASTRCEGACVDTNNDPANCGACRNLCASGQSCVSGKCLCGVGFVLCAQSCVSTTTDPKHCGRCGNACEAGEICVKGLCVLSECPQPTPTLCAGGCTDLQSNRRHCGSCGKACDLDKLCVNAICVCAPGFETCGTGRCLDLKSNNRHCGKCGNQCSEGQLCANGTCIADCPAATPATCFGGCADLKSNVLHCGTCGSRCEPGLSCQEGICCQPGFSACEGKCVDLLNDKEHCGACGNKCSSTGQCQLGQCCASGACSTAQFFTHRQEARIYDVELLPSGAFLIKGSMPGANLYLNGQSLFGTNEPTAFLLRLSPEGKLLRRETITMSSFSFLSSKGLGVGPSGDYFYAGVFTGTMRVNQTPTAINLTAPALNDFYVVRTHPTKGVVWAKVFSGNNEDLINDMIVDHKGNVLVMGGSRSSVLPGNRSVKSAAWDAVFFKIDSDGKLLWSLHGTSNGNDYVYSAAVDKENNIYTIVAGFGARGGLSLTVDTQSSKVTASASALVLKLDPTGKILWSTPLKGLTGDDRVVPKEIAIRETSQGTQVYIAGSYRGGVDLGDKEMPKAVGWSLFVGALDDNGKILWARPFAQPTLSDISAVNYTGGMRIDGKGQIHLIGHYESRGLQIGDTTLENIGANADSFLVRLDPSAKVLGVYPFAGLGSEFPYDLEIGAGESTYVVGSVTGSYFEFLKKPTLATKFNFISYFLHIR